LTAGLRWFVLGGVVIKYDEQTFHLPNETVPGNTVSWKQFLHGGLGVLADGLHEAQGLEPTVALWANVHHGPGLIDSHVGATGGVALTITIGQHLKINPEQFYIQPELI
jgi:hypothetical protein